MEETNVMDEVEKVVGEVVDDVNNDSDSVSDGITHVIVEAGTADSEITKLAVIVGTAAGIGAAAVCGGLVWAGKKLYMFGKDKIEAGKSKKAEKKSKKDAADEDQDDNASEDNTESNEASNNKKTSKK